MSPTRAPVVAGRARSPAGSPSRAPSRSRRSRPRTGRSSPSSETSPQATVSPRDRRSRATTRGRGPAAGRAPARATVTPPARLRVDRRRPLIVDAGRAAPSTATSSASRLASMPAAVAPRPSGTGRRDQRLDLDEQRAAALEDRRDGHAGARRVRGRRRRTRRPGPHLRQAGRRSSRGRRPPRSSRSGSWRAQQPQGRVAVALEHRAPRRRGARASWARRGCRPW